MKIERECEECGALCLDDDGNLTPVAHDLIEQQAARIAILERERDEAIAAEEKVQELHDRAVKDAERYEWARAEPLEFERLVQLLTDDDLDAEIDRRIAEQAKEGVCTPKQ